MNLEKVTKRRKPAFRRRYYDACAAAHALDLLGDRWSLLVVRELTMGPKRFTDLRAGLPGISANVLTQRLEELEAVGVLLRRKLPPARGRMGLPADRMGRRERAHLPGPRPLGGALAAPRPQPAVQQREPHPLAPHDVRPEPRGGPDRAARACGSAPRPFSSTSRQTGSKSPRGPIDAAEAVLAGDARAVAAAIYAGRPLRELEAESAVAVEGDRALAGRFLPFSRSLQGRAQPARPSLFRRPGLGRRETRAREAGPWSCARR
jgi:DNA-binding HxlR family transcriptional regulator